ncbi:MAG: tetratricopeptide repeat protein [Flavobacteriia bacterium]|nr:tetratricopeptide repeat protein [Flavobacteriia bacterium]
MKNNKNNINSSLSREDISTYRETKSESSKHAIEAKSLHSDFDTDALEGWEAASVGIENMASLDKQFKPRSFNTLYSLSIITFVCITFLVFYVKNENTISLIHKKQGFNPPKIALKIEETDILIPQQIEVLEEIPEHKQIKPQTISQDFEKKEDLKKESYLKQNNDIIEPLPKQKIESIPIVKEISKRTFKAKEIYLSDMKLVDYREYRSKPIIETKQLIITGTPANKEMESAQTDEEAEWKSIDIPYIEYLDKSIALFSKGNFKKALTRFEVILKTYPDDINANFYAGLCYYNLKDSDKAIQCFENCLKSEFSNFNEESEWYLAKSYFQMGNKEKAKQILESIKKKAGYYANQVEEFETKIY